MLLSDTTIKKYLSEGLIKILPAVKTGDIKSIGIRMHLGKDFLKPVLNKQVSLDSKAEDLYERITVLDEDYILKPNEFILGTTVERFMVPRNLVGYLDGRSTLARLGLGIHMTSQFADGNYDNASAITLEIKNNGTFNLVLKPGMPIGMLSFFELSEPVSKEAEFLYKNQTSVRPPEFN